MIQSRRRTSLLGIVALLGGIAALALPRLNLPNLPMVGVSSIHVPLAHAIALGALLLALIAFVAAASSPRTGTFLPIVAILVCLAAVTLAFYPQLRSWRAKAAIKPAPLSRSKAPQQPPDAAAPGIAHRSNIKTIFDPNYPSSPLPAAGAKPPAKWSPPPLASEPASAPTAQEDIANENRSARAKLRAARTRIIHALESNPDYRAAKADADAAETDLKGARLTYEPGSTALVAASQAALEARARLDHLISAALARDGDAQEAARQLKATPGR